MDFAHHSGPEKSILVFSKTGKIPLVPCAGKFSIIRSIFLPGVHETRRENRRDPLQKNTLESSKPIYSNDNQSPSQYPSFSFNDLCQNGITNHHQLHLLKNVVVATCKEGNAPLFIFKTRYLLCCQPPTWRMKQGQPKHVSIQTIVKLKGRNNVDKTLRGSAYSIFISSEFLSFCEQCKMKFHSTSLSDQSTPASTTNSGFSRQSRAWSLQAISEHKSLLTPLIKSHTSYSGRRSTFIGPLWYVRQLPRDWVFT